MRCAAVPPPYRPYCRYGSTYSLSVAHVLCGDGKHHLLDMTPDPAASVCPTVWVMRMMCRMICQG